MLSQRAKSWRWYDWVLFLLLVIIIVVGIRLIAPTSGLAHALHTGFHALVLGLQWIATGLNDLAGLLNQL